MNKLIVGSLPAGMLAIASAQTELREVCKKDFLIGAAVSQWQFSDATSSKVQIIDENISAFSKPGLKVMITELDVNVLPVPEANGADVSTRFAADPKWNPNTNGLPEEASESLPRRYAELFKVFLAHRHSLPRVTFWGVSDRSSWLNAYPIRGRTNYPLLLDRNGRPKAAFETVADIGHAASSPPSRSCSKQLP